MTDTTALRALIAKVAPGPYYVSSDGADDCPPHCQSGLARVDSDTHKNCKFPHWPIARLCEWPEANLIAAAFNALPGLCDELDALRACVKAADAMREQYLEVWQQHDPQKALPVRVFAYDVARATLPEGER